MKIVTVDREASHKAKMLVLVTEPQITQPIAESLQGLVRQRMNAPEFTAIVIDGKLGLIACVPDSSFGAWVQRLLDEAERSEQALHGIFRAREELKKKGEIDQIVNMAKQLGFPTD